MAFTAAEEQEIREIQAKLEGTKVVVQRSYAAFKQNRTRRDERRERREREQERKKAKALMVADLKKQGVQVYESASALAWLIAFLAPILRPIVEAAIERLLDQIFN